MLELTGAHIAKLNDEDLRHLVFWLCEAELRRHGQPTASVTAGGNQTAPDGGIDVRVEIPSPVHLDFIQRATTGFQVKCEDMPHGKIAEEMCPKGVLRSSIAELVTAGGAYVIVSSKGSVTDGSLLKRRNAMRQAIEGVLGTDTALVDFYDRDRLANWAREYPGVELWLRERIAEPLSGWRGYSNWAGDPPDSEYLEDDTGRMLSKTTGSPEAMPVSKGIEAIRDTLEKPGGVVRLVGLSGMGKTRLVQALFDERAGTNALDKAIVLYTDQGQSPQPTARDMLLRLGANGQRAIVVVDNCNPTTHQALTQTVLTYATQLSLITVEYDMTDDEPEETHVFELTAASENVLAGILKRLAPHVAQVDRTRIAEFAGGNARIAMALARTVKKGETLGVLNDTELFKRLFNQNQQTDAGLLRAAEASSLVYSFDGVTVDGSEAELSILAVVADMTTRELFRHIAELKRRDLVQERSKWRAVLPQALANRLAKQALLRIPPDHIVASFRSDERLLRSFSRRLGYLHDSPQACAIAERWMEDEQWLANLTTLSDSRLTLFVNLAPLVPQKALATLEAAADGEAGTTFLAPSWPSRDRWISLAHSLAYDAALFDRAARLVLRYAAAENGQARSTEQAWRELFHVVLSGTQAPPQQRLTFLRNLLEGVEQKYKELAVGALDAMLESWHFTSSHNFDFGARPRGYGWEPATLEDVRAWYSSVFELVKAMTQAESHVRQKLRTIVAGHLRALWLNLDMQQEIVELAMQLVGVDGWVEGWAAVRITLRYDAESMSPEHRQLLINLEELLRPKTLRQRVRAYVFSKTFGHLDIADGEDDEQEDTNGVKKDSYERVAEKVEIIAREVAADAGLLEELLPELVMVGLGRQRAFGRGLAIASENVAECWQQLCTAFEKTEPGRRNLELLRGFIEGAGVVDAPTTEKLLDAAVHSSLLAEHFPLLQSACLSLGAGERLLAALEQGAAPARNYHWVGYRRYGQNLPVSLYRDVLLRIAQLPDGFAQAIESLGLELHLARTQKSAPEPGLLTIGRELLGLFNFEITGGNIEFHVNGVAAACLQGPQAVPIAQALCQRFARTLLDYKRGADSFRELACTLFKYQPESALDAFLGQPPTALGFPLLTRFALSRKSVVNCADMSALLAWGACDPGKRLPLLAAEIEILGKDDGGNLTWSPVAAKLLTMASDKAKVLEIYAGCFRPRMWSGSLADVLLPYHEMVTRLSSDADPTVSKWATNQASTIKARIAQEQQMERGIDESFE